MKLDQNRNRRSSTAQARRTEVSVPSRTAFRWKSSFALTLLATLLALALAEGLMRAFRVAPSIRPLDTSEPDSPYRWSDNPILGYELNPNSPGVNSHGQRDVERVVHKPSGVRRLILLGDSVLEGREANSLGLDELISRQLERQYSNPQIEVLNFSCGGYCTLAEVELLRTKGLTFQPDVVVVVFVENDFQNVSDGIGIRMAQQRPDFVNWAFRHLHLFRQFCVKTGCFEFVRHNDPAQANLAAIGPNNVVQGLERLKSLARQHGFTPYVAVWPVFLDNDIVDSPLIAGSDALVVEVIANGYGIPVARLSEYFRAHVKSLGYPVNPRQAFTIGDGMHPNAEGSRVAALALQYALNTGLDQGPARMPWKDAPAELVQSAIQTAGDLGEAVQGTRWDYTTARLRGAAYWEDRDDFTNAMAQYEDILSEDPNNAHANAGLGRLLLDQGNLERARVCLERAYQADPDNSDGSLDLGVLHTAAGEFEQAKACFERSVSLDPSSFPAHLNLAGLLVQMGDESAARAHFDRALQLEPGSSATHFHLGILLLNQNAPREALDHLIKALMLNPTSAAARQAVAKAEAALQTTGPISPAPAGGSPEVPSHE